MGVRSRRSNSKRRRAATVSIGDSGGVGGVDLISGLNDDLLLRSLYLVPDAENVVRTHALSRRWRGLWTGVAALRFDFSSWRKLCRSDAAAERYIAFVNGALALRATAAKEPAFVEDLAISFDISEQETGQLVPLSVEAAQGWIRYAVQHAVKSFILKLMLPWQWRFDLDRDDNDIEHPVMTLDEMDNNFAKMETMHLRLGGAELRLPCSTVVFPSLIDLSLEDIEVPAGGGYLLSRLVSSACCPRLHKLRLRQLSFDLSTIEVLRIEADTLLELSLESMFKLQFLELRTPSLQVLHIEDSFDLNGFTVSAPRLENLRFCVQQPLHIDDVHGQLSSVGTLKIQMFSHGETDAEDRNDAGIHVLQCCRLTRCLEVSFEIPKTKYQTVDIIKGRIPLLPHVTHLAVDIKLWERHSAGPGVACLLAQCSNIKYLRLQLCYIIKKKNQSELDLLCDNNSCHWRSHEFSLDHLEKVEFKELMGTDCEFQFIQSILTKATGIRKVTISFDRFYWRKGRKHAFKLMPPLDGGLWTTCKWAKLIESDTLLELSLKAIFKLQFLELSTPSLRALYVENCFDLDLFTVSAPRLENLIAMCLAKRPFRRIDVHCHLSSVETLKIQLFSRGGTETGYNEDVNDGSIHLLQCCRSTRCLEVSFKVSEAKYNTVDIIKGRIPLLPHVTHLAVYIELWERHSTGPGVACLLAQCSNIKYLSLQLRYIITKENRSELDFLCDNNSCHWKSREFLLAHLQEVEFKKLMGTDCEFQFIQSILTKATGIQKVTISFDRKDRKHACKLMPPLDGGLWTTCKGATSGDVVHEWRLESSREIADVHSC